MKDEQQMKTSCDVPALWLEHQNELRNFIFNRLKDRDQTEDILQEVLMKVYKFCLSTSGVKNLRSWLFQIAHNTMIDHYRRQSKYSSSEVPEFPQEDENLAYKDATEYIKPMLGFLPEAYALPLQMADLDGIKQKEIAKRLGLTLTATKTRIQRARQLLKEEFITCCHLETDSTGNLISFSIKDSCKPLQEIKNKNI